ncbi:class I SAM-dependent methyltransferase [Croceiramulus getboli]|nr:methyltransferase domain-containing protein [Flavobacteriaceae bacterium YJPT1-3]
MKNLNKHIENHYLKAGLFEEIVHRLRAQGIDINALTRSDISGVDEFHVRGAAVSKELAQTANIHNLKVLDVGCGLGGPSRMLADEFGCTVTGIDLSKEYIRTAQELSGLLHLDDKTRFIVGDATSLPFENASFDVVWTQHAQMNIPDKRKLYSEIHRVLKFGGYFLYYDIFKDDDKEVNYPMPWASSADHSFLWTTSAMKALLLRLGFEKVTTTNQTKAGIAFFEHLFDEQRPTPPSKMGLDVLMGESTKPKLRNLMDHLKNKSLTLESGIYTKCALGN